MKFWEILKNETVTTKKNLSRLHEKIATKLPGSTEDDLIKVACFAGLLARVAWVDFKLDPSELSVMRQVLSDWTKMDRETIDTIVAISTDEIQELAGLENHLYCHPLQNIMSENERYDLLVSLFAIAAGDESVEQLESEEIRIITQGLNLTHKHYISARATVMDKLKALKKTPAK